MKLLIWIVSLAAIVLALVIAVSGPGTRFGVWDYGFGLGLIRKAALPLMIATGLSVVSFVLALITARQLAPLALIATLMGAGAAFVPIKMKELAEANPYIHDITTDFSNPPQIITAADFERANPAAYVGDEPAPGSELSTADAQREAFPDIAPIMTTVAPEEAMNLSRDIVEAMSMNILNEETSETTRIIEAAYKSTWFGFVDDFVVRISEEGGKTRIDLRSKSRVGTSDLGANAARIRDFISRFEAAS
ncbi:MAG: hypothetical protein DHS20C05_15850 [Hyphococcus sp.]|nr:MAG: hypothetical protein DHS20C05_15850 [Marinicaulis sp.]